MTLREYFLTRPILIVCRRSTTRCYRIVTTTTHDYSAFNASFNLANKSGFFRTISKYIYGTENNYANLGEAAYHYIVENLTQFYEYCYIENGTYYIDIEKGGIIEKYILDDYIEEIKKDRVYAGYIEINAISIIINRPIIFFNWSFKRYNLF